MYNSLTGYFLDNTVLVATAYSWTLSKTHACKTAAIVKSEHANTIIIYIWMCAVLFTYSLIETILEVYCKHRQ